MADDEGAGVAVEIDPDGDWDWCLAFGEGNAKNPRVPPPDIIDKVKEKVKEELADGAPAPEPEAEAADGENPDAVQLELPASWDRWPAQGYTTPPDVEKPVSEWGDEEWKSQADWEALSWEERCGEPQQRRDTVTLLKTDGFYRMMTQYMQEPWKCPVHTLKLAFMKAGLQVEERMNKTYDVLFLVVRGDDDFLEKKGREMAEAGLVPCKRTLVVSPKTEADIARESSGPDLGSYSKWNPVRDEYMSPELYDWATRCSKHGEEGEDDTKWGLKMGMSTFDMELKHNFEDRRLNTHLFTTKAEYDDGSFFGSSDDAGKFPHPRFFNSGERQQIVKGIMENVEWARYLPTKLSGDDERHAADKPTYTAYPGVQLTQEWTDEQGTTHFPAGQVRTTASSPLCPNLS